jgi:glyoxylase-like metal-dependent hydrolase (beta-lactamase superfamily II)/rhodanese-related sulfurtransferase
MTIATSNPSISPTDLADRLAQGEQVTVLDVREDAAWPIESHGVNVHHVPASAVVDDPATIVERLSGPVVVVCARGVTAQRITELLRGLGADARFLEGGMRGWWSALQARNVDLGLPGVAVVQVQRPGRGCLSYLVASGGAALVVDPAPDAEFYVALAEAHGAEVTHVFDTHLHADHLSGARPLADRTGATLHLPVASLERGVAYAGRVQPLADGDAIEVGGVTAQVIALPGHTTDMAGLLIGGRALIGGDSLFADGIARPDLQRGDADGARAMGRTLHGTLRERVLTLPGETVLLPCHTHPGVAATAIAPTIAEVRSAVPQLALEDPDAFAEDLLADMPPRPANYESVIAVNAGTIPFDADLEMGGNSCSTR